MFLQSQKTVRLSMQPAINPYKSNVMCWQFICSMQLELVNNAKGLCLRFGSNILHYLLLPLHNKATNQGSLKEI